MAKTSKKIVTGAAIADTMLENPVLTPEQVAAMQPAEGPTPSANPVKTTDPVKDMVAYQESTNAEVTAQEQAGSNNPPDPIKEEVLEHFIPRLTIENAKKDALLVQADINTASNELAGPLVSRLALDLADIGFVWYRDNKLVFCATFEEEFLKMVKANNIVGPLQKKKEVNEGKSAVIKVGDGSTARDVGVVIEMVSPYTGSNLAVLKAAIVRASMLIFGHRCGAKRGYLSRKEGTGQRFGKGKVWSLQTTSEDDFEAICIPFNKVFPFECFQKKVGNEVFLTHDLKSPITDETLRYLADDWAQGWADHIFRGSKLTYDMVGLKASGFLTKEKKQRDTNQGSAGAQQVNTDIEKFAPEAKDYIRKLNAESEKKIAEATKATIGGDLTNDAVWATYDQLTALIAKRSNPMGERGMVSVLSQAIMLCKMRLQSVTKENKNTKLVAYAAAELRDILDAYVGTKGDDRVWLGPDGKELWVIKDETAQAKVA